MLDFESLTDGAPPADWEGSDAAAGVVYQNLESELEVQAGEILPVINALDDAADEFSMAKSALHGSLRYAGANGLTVDMTTGFVQSAQPVADDEVAAVEDDIARVVNGLNGAIERAVAADQALTLAFTTAGSNDLLGECYAMNQADRLDHLLNNPEAAREILSFLSEQDRQAWGQQLGERLNDLGQTGWVEDPAVIAEFNIWFDRLRRRSGRDGGHVQRTRC
ncbi:MAG: hypothetical protein ACK5H2_04560 [Beutenbergiaceae bacterium]